MDETAFKQVTEMIAGLSDRLAAIETFMPQIERSLGFPAGLGVLASVVTSGGFPRGLTGTIRGKAPGGNDCEVVVTATTAYVVKRRTTTTTADGQTTTCTTYEITVTVTVTEENCPQGTNPMTARTTTHKFEKTYCGTDSDSTSWGSTTGFDGVETDTLTFGHGTRVKVERGKPQGKTTITVTYPDGTSVSTVAP